METVAVCVTVLVGLVLVLRHLERAALAASAVVAKSVETELREALKSAEMRLSKLEMTRAMTR